LPILAALDPAGQGGIRGIDEGLIHRIGCSHDEADGRIAAPALQECPAINAEQITVLEFVSVGDSVDHRIIHAGTDHAGKRN